MTPRSCRRGPTRPDSPHSSRPRTVAWHRRDRRRRRRRPRGRGTPRPRPRSSSQRTPWSSLRCAPTPPRRSPQSRRRRPLHGRRRRRCQRSRRAPGTRPRRCTRGGRRGAAQRGLGSPPPPPPPSPPSSPRPRRATQPTPRCAAERIAVDRWVRRGIGHTPKKNGVFRKGQQCGLGVISSPSSPV